MCLCVCVCFRQNYTVSHVVSQEPYALIITVYEVRDWSRGEDFFRFALYKNQNEKRHYSGMVTKISGREAYYARRKFREKIR